MPHAEGIPGEDVDALVNGLREADGSASRTT